jgi:hypothetical protein
VPARQAHRPEVDEDLVFQQRDWRVQRVAWALLALIVLAGLAGLLGPGPLSKTEARSGDALEVEYERFVRHGSHAELQVKIGIPRPNPGTVQVAISREYLSAMNLQQVIPLPARVRSAGRSLLYAFESAPGKALVQATFVIEPEELGSHTAEIAVADGSRVTIRQFTYP